MTRLPLDRVLRRAVRAHALSRPVGTVEDAVRAAAGVYGAAPTCHLGLALRVDGYAPAALDRALLADRTLLRVPAMRGSIYLLPPELVPHGLALAGRDPLLAVLRKLGHGEADYERWAAAVEAALAGAPKTAPEIRAALGDAAPEGPLLTYVLRQMSHTGRIVRAGTRGSARSQSWEYALMSEWMPLPDPSPTREEALGVLAPLWLAANGPASAADLAWWAGVKPKEAAAALAALGTVAVEVEGVSGELRATPELADELADGSDDGDGDGGVHLLPLWDAYLMAHRDRGRYLDPAHAPFVVDRSGNVTSVLLQGGRVAGVWDVDGPTLLYARFSPVPKREVERAARRLAPVVEVERVEEVRDPRPLSEGGQNAFMMPLRPPKPRR